MTKEQAIEALRKEQENEDLENAHLNADRVMCDLLLSLGFDDVVEEFGKVGKWYS